MATTLTPIDLTKNTWTATAPTALGGAGTAETFELTPTVPEDRVIIMLDNLASGTALTVSVSAGDYWAKGAIAGSVAAASKEMLVFDGAKVKDKDTNKITIVLTPDGAADAAATIMAIQLPPAGLLSGV
jgi:hypothetical protein